MSPEDRKSIGQMSLEEALQKFNEGEERRFKDLVRDWLNLHEIYYFTQGMHRKTARSARHS